MEKIKKIQTKKESISQRREEGESIIETVISGLYGDLSNLPEYNDQNEVYRKAFDDIRRMDFSEMGSYIDSLVQVADFWQEKAEHYFDELKERGVSFDENGYLNE